MNCQDGFWRGKDPKEVSRRWFFEQCGVGLGSMALANLLAEAGLADTQERILWRRRSHHYRRRRRM